MNAIQLAAVPGVEDLDEGALLTTSGGFPVAPVVWGVGIYLAKTVGDHWGDFKEGVTDGLRTVWGER